MQFANISIVAVGLIHFGVAAGEIFLWKSPKVSAGLKAKLSLDPATVSNVAPIVANAGLYNAFIGAGLLYSVLQASDPFKIFFLSCVAIAGAFGAVTLRPTTLLLQALPALVAGFLVWFHR